MNTRLIQLGSAVAVLGIAMGPLLPCLHAQQSALPATGTSTVIRPGIPASEGELTPAVQARVSRGDALTGSRNFAAAQREYRAAAEMARREGHLPSLTLWHLASAHYYAGDLRHAATVLDQLAAEAARHGELVVEALALYDAAWLKNQDGRDDEAARQVAALKTLMRSPYLPLTVREYLDSRLTPPAAVADMP